MSDSDELSAVDVISGSTTPTSQPVAENLIELDVPTQQLPGHQVIRKVLNTFKTFANRNKSKKYVPSKELVLTPEQGAHIASEADRVSKHLVQDLFSQLISETDSDDNSDIITFKTQHNNQHVDNSSNLDASLDDTLPYRPTSQNTCTSSVDGTDNISPFVIVPPTSIDIDLSSIDDTDTNPANLDEGLLDHERLHELHPIIGNEQYFAVNNTSKLLQEDQTIDQENSTNCNTVLPVDSDKVNQTIELISDSEGETTDQRVYVVAHGNKGHKNLIADTTDKAILPIPVLLEQSDCIQDPSPNTDTVLKTVVPSISDTFVPWHKNNTEESNLSSGSRSNNRGVDHTQTRAIGTNTSRSPSIETLSIDDSCPLTLGQRTPTSPVTPTPSLSDHGFDWATPEEVRKQLHQFVVSGITSTPVTTRTDQFSSDNDNSAMSTRTKTKTKTKLRFEPQPSTSKHNHQSPSPEDHRRKPRKSKKRSRSHTEKKTINSESKRSQKKDKKSQDKSKESAKCNRQDRATTPEDSSYRSSEGNTRKSKSVQPSSVEMSTSPRRPVSADEEYRQLVKSLTDQVKAAMDKRCPRPRPRSRSKSRSKSPSKGKRSTLKGAVGRKSKSHRRRTSPDPSPNPSEDNSDHTEKHSSDTDEDPDYLPDLESTSSEDSYESNSSDDRHGRRGQPSDRDDSDEDPDDSDDSDNSDDSEDSSNTDSDRSHRQRQRHRRVRAAYPRDTQSRNDELRVILKEVRRSYRNSPRGGTKKEPFEFGGSEDSLPRWIEALELFFYINNTPSKLQYSVAKQYLKGNALLMIELFERQQKAKLGRQYHRMSWKDLKRRLYKEFNSEMAVHSLDSVYQRRTQGDKESAKDYIDTMMDMGSRLGKEHDDIKSRIMAGFRVDIHDRIRLHTPKSLQHLRHIAEIVESGLNNEKRSHRKSQINKIDVPTDIDSICTVTKIVNEPYVKQLETLTAAVKQLQTTHSPPTNIARNRSQSPMVRKCFECGSEEHLVRDCPQFRARMQKDPKTNTGTGGGRKRFNPKKKGRPNTSGSDKSESDGRNQPQSWNAGPNMWNGPPAYQSWSAPWYSNTWGTPSMPPPNMPPPNMPPPHHPPPPQPTPTSSEQKIQSPPATRQHQGNV